MTPAGGIVVVDKPAGCTSHDVVARVRRLAGTRRVGHAGTLDPMATGVLVVGVERATRLLGHLSGQDKSYDATIRLGITTSTDDAEGEVVATSDASGVRDGDLDAALAAQVGDIAQVPPAVSAISVDGVRSYKRARRGDAVVLEPRQVTVRDLVVRSVRRTGAAVDVDVSVTCSTGTYIRAIARDVGAALGVGGHLTALRRTRSGVFGIAQARSLEQLDVGRDLVPLAAAAASAFPRRDVAEEVAAAMRHGVKLPAQGVGDAPVAVFGSDGDLLALVADEGDRLRYLAVFTS